MTSDDSINSRVNIENHDDAQDWKLATISMLEKRRQQKYSYLPKNLF